MEESKKLSLKTLGDETVNAVLGKTVERNKVKVDEVCIYLHISDKKGRYTDIAMLGKDQAKELANWILNNVK